MKRCPRFVAFPLNFGHAGLKRLGAINQEAIRGCRNSSYVVQRLALDVIELAQMRSASSRSRSSSATRPPARASSSYASAITLSVRRESIVAPYSIASRQAENSGSFTGRPLTLYVEGHPSRAPGLRCPTNPSRDGFAGRRVRGTDRARPVRPHRGTRPAWRCGDRVDTGASTATSCLRRGRARGASRGGQRGRIKSRDRKRRPYLPLELTSPRRASLMV